MELQGTVVISTASERIYEELQGLGLGFALGLGLVLELEFGLGLEKNNVSINVSCSVGPNFLQRTTQMSLHFPCAV